MNIDLSQYYWNNGFITLHRPRETDWETTIPNMYKSEERFFFNDEIDMPVDVEDYRKSEIFTAPDKLSFICFAIEDGEGCHVGFANLFGIDERNGVFGPIGIVINPANRRKGYAMAALRLLGRYMFEERRMHKWNSGYIDGNAASAALHKSLGFKVEGLRRDMVYHAGRYWSVVDCGITEAEFFENEKRLPEINQQREDEQ